MQQLAVPSVETLRVAKRPCNTVCINAAEQRYEPRIGPPRGMCVQQVADYNAQQLGDEDIWRAVQGHCRQRSRVARKLWWVVQYPYYESGAV